MKKLIFVLLAMNVSCLISMDRSTDSVSSSGEVNPNTYTRDMISKSAKTKTLAAYLFHAKNDLKTVEIKSCLGNISLSDIPVKQTKSKRLIIDLKIIEAMNSDLAIADINIPTESTINNLNSTITEQESLITIRNRTISNLQSTIKELTHSKWLNRLGGFGIGVVSCAFAIGTAWWLHKNNYLPYQGIN